MKPVYSLAPVVAVAVGLPVLALRGGPLPRGRPHHDAAVVAAAIQLLGGGVPPAEYCGGGGVGGEMRWSCRSALKYSRRPAQRSRLQQLIVSKCPPPRVCIRLPLTMSYI